MLSQRLPPATCQVSAEVPAILSDVLRDGVNLAVWQRRLPAQIEDFASLLLARGDPLAESLSVEMAQLDEDAMVPSLLGAYADLHGHAAFIADVTWLLRAFACLVDAKCIGLRLRILDKAMCPRFHVDHVPVRLITSYAGIGTQWLREGAMSRGRLGSADAEPQGMTAIEQAGTGHVLLAKGEKWHGNEGAGLIHRSPAPAQGERRLLLTLDWLA